MYVISSRPERAAPPASWAVLFSANANPPPLDKPIVVPDYMPAGFVNSLVEHVVVFVHGYSNSEENAFSACAQAAGLSPGQLTLPACGFAGTVVGYDWPTGNANTINPSAQLALYMHDLAEAQNPGAPSFEDFLDRLTTALSGRSIRISVLAHSMGNFVLTRALMENSALAGRLTDIYSFAPDILQTDLERDDLRAAADALHGLWFVYWAKSDMVLMTASDWANILLGTETLGQERLGQAGLQAGGTYSSSVIPQQWDPFLAEVGVTSFDDTTENWRSSMGTHMGYWKSPEFWQNVAQNLNRKDESTPVIAPQPQPASSS